MVFLLIWHLNPEPTCRQDKADCPSTWLMINLSLSLSLFFQEYLTQFYDGWRDLMDNKSDPRTRDYPLMSSPFPTIAISLSYAYFVKVSDHSTHTYTQREGITVQNTHSTAINTSSRRSQSIINVLIGGEKTQMNTQTKWRHLSRAWPTLLVVSRI